MTTASGDPTRRSLGPGASYAFGETGRAFFDRGPLGAAVERRSATAQSAADGVIRAPDRASYEVVRKGPFEKPGGVGADGQP